MPENGKRSFLMLSAVLAAAGAIAWGVLHGGHAPSAAMKTIAAVPASIPTSAATSGTAPPSDFMGVVRDAYPDFPTTEPLAIPAELREGARLILKEPLYLDSSGELWITRSDAPPIPAVLKAAGDQQVHLVREHVLFVHYFLDEDQQWQPQIVSTDGDGNNVLISTEGRLSLGNHFAYRWDCAFDWNSTTNEGFAVPTETGVSVFRPRSIPVESHFEFAAATSPPKGSPQMLLDNRGLLAWIPWEKDQPGSRGAARFVDGKWQALGPDQGWPEKLLHLIPLIGGGVLQLVVHDDGTTAVLRAQLDADSIEAKTVDPLIAQLSDPDPNVRETASNELTRYGPGLWPILEKERDDQPPEGHVRIDRLLAAKQNPTLGRMTLLPGPVRVLAHLQDGGALIESDAGVSVPSFTPGLPPVVTSPAYISIRPDRPIDLAPDALIKDLSPDARFAIAPDEWIVTDGSHGSRRLLGNHLEPLLRKSERQFSEFAGVDRKGRWLFRKPDQLTPTLLLDPNLPDATPRIAAWVDPVACDVAAWDDAGWPVVIKNNNAWALHAEEWSPLPAMPQPKPKATSTSTTPSPIFTDADGTAYFDGQIKLRVQHKDGSTMDWPLPPAGVGTGEVHLLRTGDNHLFLFNQPGRLLRIVPTPGGVSPFKIEANFTRQIPNADHYTRVWLDPAGRIDLVYDKSHLAILFPDGRIPRAISEKMPAAQLKDEAE